MYKIPSDKEITRAIRKVIKKCSISSQCKLRELVQAELSKRDPEYRVSGTRVRHLAISSKSVKLEIVVRHGGDIGEMHLCPVCTGKLKSIRNKTLYDWDVTLGYKCPKCPYWTSRHLRIPRRYIFHGR